MFPAPFEKMSETAEAVCKFQTGEYGESQSLEVAQTLTDDKEAVKVIAYMLQLIHAEGRDKLARSCPFMARRE